MQRRGVLELIERGQLARQQLNAQRIGVTNAPKENNAIYRV
jgi:hypothetical protein